MLPDNFLLRCFRRSSDGLQISHYHIGDLVEDREGLRSLPVIDADSVLWLGLP